jgi:hypothetical protein
MEGEHGKDNICLFGGRLTIGSVMCRKSFLLPFKQAILKTIEIDSVEM